MNTDYYPDSTYNSPDAPWNEIPRCDCSRCDGTGKLFYKIDEEFMEIEVSKEEYESLPIIADHGDIQGDIEDCPDCEGTGKVPRY